MTDHDHGPVVDAAGYAPPMRIVDLTTHVLYDGYRNLIFVRLLTDEGLSGLGEATLINRTEAVVAYLHGHVKPVLLGQDPAMAGRLWRDIYSGGFVRGGITTSAGLSAVATALLDIEGKRLGVPCWQLLGGAVHERVPVYANAWYTVEREPRRSPSGPRIVLGMGYRALKIDPFGPGSYELSRDEERRSLAILGAVRDAVGPDVELFVEGHGRFSTGQATATRRRVGRRSARAGSRSRRPGMTRRAGWRSAARQPGASRWPAESTSARATGSGIASPVAGWTSSSRTSATAADPSS